ncbi:LINE-1 retrotransposable element ORF1 protein [Dissostichus eleginoides]|uniref:LINE-1 retrotransposable element ORF1 protein n=1 Tax=Dissostichus eleginoides TaxID=100907 RepID=A0AAD9F1X0_DISEL|nr:LINE-1 retrotransposable element ORF1 protein [Dissostichus eleginoides]
MGDLSKDVKALQGKMLDLEARSRRNNLILAGLPEGKEAGGISPLLDKILRHFLKLSDALRPIPDPGHPPRHIIDFPMEIQCQRDSYRELRSILCKENLRHGILYPARLIVTINEETFIFKEPKEAEKVLKEKRPDLFGK